MTLGIVQPPPSGSLRHKFDIIRRDRVQGTQGQPVKSTTNVGCIRVAIQTLSGNEFEQANRRFATATHVFVARHSDVLKVTDRLEGCKGCFEVLHIEDVEFRGIRDRIVVREIKP